MNDQEKWLELADLYAVGALEGEDLALFESRLKGGCKVSIARLQENQELLVRGLRRMPLTAPDAAVKMRLMESLESDVFVPASVERVLSPWTAMLIWVALSGVVLWMWNATSLQRHTREFQRLETSMMGQAGAQKVILKSPKAGELLSAKIMWNRKGDCLFTVMGLPKISKDKSYEIWGISNGKPVAMGTFEVDDHGCAVFVAKEVKAASFDQFAVTLEPAGGVPAPTGPVVLAGAI